MTPTAALRAIEARRAFVSEIAGMALPRSLTRAALAVAAEDFGTDIQSYIAKLDSWSSLLIERLEGNSQNSISVLNHFVFEELGFQGNFENYYDPRNSYLSYVIDRRRGIPITLSLVYMHLAISAGIDAYGIGMPGHFLVGVNDQGRTTLVDCFNGRTVNENQCREKLDELFNGRIDLTPEHLKRSSSRQIIYRLLSNLKSAYARCGLYKQAIAVIERLLVVEPASRLEYLDRARFKARLGKNAEALAAFEDCLNHSSDESERAEIRKEMNELIGRMAELN